MFTLQKPGKTQTKSVLKFEAGWRESLSAPIYQGSKLVIDYEPSRLPACRSDGPLNFPGWGIKVFIKFDSDGQVHEGHLTQMLEDAAEIERRVSVMGNQGWLKSVPFELDVPQNATQVEIWFNNYDYSQCSTWDSRYGQNYIYPVFPERYTSAKTIG
ncbi:MAG: DUF6209 family protein [Leptolyngbya sp. BL-A-14]